MSDRPQGTDATQTAPIHLDLPEGVIDARMELPRGPMRLAEFAFEVTHLSSVVADLGIRQTEKLGHKVTCAKGCAACCRPMVPLSPPEAWVVTELIDSLAEPMRTRIEKRFAEAEALLQKEGLIEKLAALEARAATDSEHQALAREYFALGLACPFLENEACSIYDYRPSVCREHLVSSPAEMCDDPFDRPVRPLPISIRLSEALARVWAELYRERPLTVPLTLALRWTRGRPKTKTGGAPGRWLLDRLVHYLSTMAAEQEKEAGDPASAGAATRKS